MLIKKLFPMQLLYRSFSNEHIGDLITKSELVKTFFKKVSVFLYNFLKMNVPFTY